MELGLHIQNFTYPGGDAEIAPTVARIARAAEDGGFTRLTVMDHVFQIGVVGTAERAMLEAYTTLGFLAAHTERVRLHTLVTGVTYRDPGLLAKIVTTLDVLSGGRAGLGIGAAWNEEEARGLGLSFPPLAERFDRLEETLQICLRMWADGDEPYKGAHYTLERPLNSPANLTRPHPPIMIGGSGEKKTLRLVAKYADACNVFNSPDLARKLDVLREHCANEGRDYDAIEKTSVVRLQAGTTAGELLDDLRRLHELGITAAYATTLNEEPLAAIELFATEVIPEIQGW